MNTVTATGSQVASSPTPTLESHALFNGGREIHIRHGEAEYRLRITRSGKLILTK